MGIFNVTENITNMADVGAFVDSTTGGYLGLVILFVIGAVSILSVSAFNVKDGAVASAFIVFISSIFLRLMGLINPTYYAITLILLIIAVAWSLYGKGGQVGA